MKIKKRVVLSFLRTFSYVVGVVLLATTAVRAQEPFILDVKGGVEVWSVPQPALGDGYEATKIVLRGVDPASKLVTFENLRFDGDLVQTWLSGPFGTPTAKGAPEAGPTYMAEWIPYDSHLLISSYMIGGQVGGGYAGISEFNDMSIGQIPGLSLVSGFPQAAGFGPIAMANPTDAFFLGTSFQTNEVDLAYLVRQTGAGAADGHITMTLGVLGSGVVNSGQPGGASFGFNGNDPVVIRFIPEPSAMFLVVFALAAVTCLRRRTRGT